MEGVVLHAPLIGFDVTLVMNMITVIVLFLILRKFFFKKVHDFIVARQAAVQDSFDNAEATNRKADEKLNAYNNKLADIESEARDIIKNAKLKAENQTNAMIEEANNKIEDMMAKARFNIEKERAEAVADMKNQIIMLSLMAAEKIIEKDLEIEGQEAFIDKIIEQAGTSEWLN